MTYDKKLRATYDLIDSVGQGYLVGDKLHFAMSLLESSNSNDSHEQRELNSRNNGVSCDEYFKKIEHIYRNRMLLYSDNHQIISIKIDKVQMLYKKMIKNMSDLRVKKIMIFLGHLIGTKYFGQCHTEDLFNHFPGRKYEASFHSKRCGVRCIKRKENNICYKSGSMISPNDFLHKNTEYGELGLHVEGKDLLRECLYALLNIQGENFRHYSHSEIKDSTSNGVNEKLVQNEGFHIRPSAFPYHMNLQSMVNNKYLFLLRSSALDTLKVCCEAGWLYSRVQFYIDSVLKIGEKTFNGNSGIISRALASTLNSEMASYLKFVVSMEENIFSQSDSKITARDLVSQLRSPITKLRTIALVTDGISPRLTGGELLTSLHLHSMHGDKRHRNFLHSIIYTVSLPWYSMLYDWIMLGNLPAVTTSSHGIRGEFFIEENFYVTDKYLWYDRYFICESQIPYLPGFGNGKEILSIDNANDILDIGKGINFIRKCLKDMEWNIDIEHILPSPDSVLDLKVDFVDHEEMRKRLGFYFNPRSNDIQNVPLIKGMIKFSSKPLERTIKLTARQVHSHILSSLFDEHNLYHHLHGLKKIIFMAQGDFISIFIDRLHLEFKTQKETTVVIYMNTLTGILHDSIKMTNANFLPQFVLEKIHVTLWSPSMNTDWEYFDIDWNIFYSLDGINRSQNKRTIFTLNYDICLPLTPILHSLVIEKYQRVYLLLFYLKRIELMLNNIWRQTNLINHNLHIMTIKDKKKLSGLSAHHNSLLFRIKLFLKKLSIARQTMFHFILNLQSYLMFEVLESEWNNLLENIKVAETLDDIIYAHGYYLNKIINMSLLGRNEQQNLGQQLRYVLTISYIFCEIHERILSEALLSVNSVEGKLHSLEFRTKDFKFNSESMSPSLDWWNFCCLSEVEKINTVELLNEEFHVSVRALLSMLNDNVDDLRSRKGDNMLPLQSMKVKRILFPSNGDFLNNDFLHFLTFRLDFSDFYCAY